MISALSVYEYMPLLAVIPHLYLSKQLLLWGTKSLKFSLFLITHRLVLGTGIETGACLLTWAGLHWYS